MKKIESIIDPSITRKLYSIYNINLAGCAHGTKTVKTLRFDYKWPVLDFLEPIFIVFFEQIDFQYIYMTNGSNITEDEAYLKFSKHKFIEFIKSNETYVSTRSYEHKMDDYYVFGLTIFDENLEWLIHYNDADEELNEGFGIRFFYQIEKFKNTQVLEMLKNNEWFTEEI